MKLKTLNVKNVKTVKTEIKMMIQDLLSELEHQAELLIEMKVLIARQSSLLLNKDYYHFRRSKAHRDELLKQINIHKKRLLDINLKWCKFKQNTSQEIQSKIYQKIKNIRRIVDEIKKGEKQIYIQIMNEVHKQVENS